MSGAGVGHLVHFCGRTAMNFEERALSFPCHDAWLYGVASVPEQAHVRGVLIVVGGPQYRAGSHRQFTLLARSLAAQGIPAMRFDYRGMGDSDGSARSFESVNQDLRAAIGQFISAVPGMKEVVIWGLCDAASAALFYASQDTRVTGLVLLNPWVRTTGGIAKTTLKHYYRGRLLEADLWKKILSGRFDYAAAASSFARLVGAAFGTKKDTAAAAGAASSVETASEAPLPERMLAGFSQFKGKVLLVISGNDLTAQEFLDMAQASAAWQRLLAAPRVTRHSLAEADHTFSRRVWRDQVSNWTGDWVKSW
jgi:exosortase A-associated hydrolase 1